MATHRDEFIAAEKRAAVRLAKAPTAVAARYDRRIGRLVIALSSGLEIAFKPHDAQGLEHAKPEHLSRIEISPSGLGLHFPALDADLYLPAILEGLLGSRPWMAARMGKAGAGRRPPRRQQPHARTASSAVARRRRGRTNRRDKRAAPSATRVALGAFLQSRHRAERKTNNNGCARQAEPAELPGIYPPRAPVRASRSMPVMRPCGSPVLRCGPTHGREWCGHTRQCLRPTLPLSASRDSRNLQSVSHL
jgi:Protein of unknown function (DUF2442)